MAVEVLFLGGHMESKKLLSYTILFCAVFFLSSSAIFVRLAEAPSAITAFYRLLLAAAVLVPALLWQKEGRQQLLGLSSRQRLLGLLSGLVLALHYVMWFESLRFTSVASSVVLVTLQPLFTIIGDYLLWQQRYSAKALAGCGLAILGSAYIGWGDFKIGWEAFLGDLLALGAAAVIAVYFLIGQQVRKQLSLVPYCVLGYGSGACFLGLYALALENSFSGYSCSTWWAFAGLAFVSTILGQFIFNWLLKWLSATVISMSILGETIGTCILSYFILQEVPSLQQLFGMTAILLGIGMFLHYKEK